MVSFLLGSESDVANIPGDFRDPAVLLSLLRGIQGVPAVSLPGRQEPRLEKNPRLVS